MNPHDLTDTIQLDPDKVLAKLKTSKGNFLGESQEYWACIVADHAQKLTDAATIDQYDDWFIEELAYDE